MALVFVMTIYTNILTLDITSKLLKTDV